MVSISGPLHCTPSFTRRCQTRLASQHSVSSTELGRRAYFPSSRDGTCTIDSCGQGRILSSLQHQAVLKKSRSVESKCVEVLSGLAYVQMSAPVFRKRVQKHGMMLVSQVFKPINKVKPAELHHHLKIKSLLICSSSSEDSILNGSVNLESEMKGEPTSGSSKENQSVSTSVKNSTHLLHVPVSEEQLDGRSGFASFYRNANTEKEDEFGLINSSSKTKSKSLLWFVAPFILVASIVIPPIFLRQLIEMVLEDTLVTDFVILFFTEAAFYAGAYLFLYITQKFCRPQKPEWSLAVYLQGYKVSSLICLVLSVALPILSIYLVWPWIGPAAAAALVPYMVGLVVQFWFEESMKGSPLLPHIQVIFQVYRLHQLNRGAQLAAGLLFTLKGIESTAETLAINGSLQTMMTVIQLLGIICLWSLGAFLVQTSLFQHQVPARS